MKYHSDKIQSSSIAFQIQVTNIFSGFKTVKLGANGKETIKDLNKIPMGSTFAH